MIPLRQSIGCVLCDFAKLFAAVNNMYNKKAVLSQRRQRNAPYIWVS